MAKRHRASDDGTTTRGRILDGTPQNWLLGHNGGDAGVAHWREWVTRPSGDAVSIAQHSIAQQSMWAPSGLLCYAVLCHVR